MPETRVYTDFKNLPLVRQASYLTEQRDWFSEQVSFAQAIDDELQKLSSATTEVRVIQTGTAVTDGTALKAALVEAKTLSPSEASPICIVVPDGTYDLGTDYLNWDTDYIYLRGSTSAYRTLTAAASAYSTISEAGVTITSSDPTCTILVDAKCQFHNINVNNTNSGNSWRVAAASASDDSLMLKGCSGETGGSYSMYAIDASSSQVIMNSHFSSSIDTDGKCYCSGSSFLSGDLFYSLVGEYYFSDCTIMPSMSIGGYGNNATIVNSRIYAPSYSLTLNVISHTLNIIDCEIDCTELVLPNVVADQRIIGCTINISVAPLNIAGVFKDNSVISTASSGTATLNLPYLVTGDDDVIVQNNIIVSGSETYSASGVALGSKAAVIDGNVFDKTLHFAGLNYVGTNFGGGEVVVSAPNLQDVITQGSSATLTTAVPVEVLDTDSNALLSVLSTGTGPADNDVVLGNAATSDATVQGDTLNLVDDTYSKTLTEVVESIATNTSGIASLESAAQKILYAQTDTTSTTTDTSILAETLGGVDYPSLPIGYQKTWNFILEAHSVPVSDQNCKETWNGTLTAINVASGSEPKMVISPLLSSSDSDATLSVTDVSIVSDEIQITVQHNNGGAYGSVVNWEMRIEEIYSEIAFLVI